MKILAKTGDENIAVAYIAEMDNGKQIEFVESVQPPIPREDKWVLIVSTLYGCPVGCPFCDAGNQFQGKLSQDDILNQIDFMVLQRYPDRRIPAGKFKIQFSRMGEPALNPNVLEVLRELPHRYQTPGLMPTISTVAPSGVQQFFDELIDIKNTYYHHGFQLQFSIHSTDREQRDRLIPIKKWTFPEIADYGRAFHTSGERKITLNFALPKGIIIDPDVLLEYFDPEIFLIKITPVNPTYQASRNNITSYIVPNERNYNIINILQDIGYDVILSIGELTENLIGSNCGQYLSEYLKKQEQIEGGYSYPLQMINID